MESIVQLGVKATFEKGRASGAGTKLFAYYLAAKSFEEQPEGFV